MPIGLYHYKFSVTETASPAELTPELLARTYGGEMIVLDGGERAVVVQHHEH